MITLIGSTKGGAGKSTIATGVAAGLAGAGDVLLVDTDIQATARKWHGRREGVEGAAALGVAQASGNVVKVLRDYAKRYQHVVVDAGGHDSAELRSAACAADQILIPLRPSIADMDALAETIEVVRLARGFNPDLKAFVVLTMAPTNYRVRDAEIARMVVQESEHVQLLDCVLHDRKAYRDALLAGVGPTELARNRDAGALAAGAEIAALIATLFAA